MFACPIVTPPDELEGDSDENPIQLQGDSVEEVRALMGYLYSLCVSLHSVDGLYLYGFRLQTTRGPERFDQWQRLQQLLPPRTHRPQIPL